MECKKFELAASEYLDRQLDERSAREYREHIADCGSCRLRLVETEQVSLMLKGVELPSAPAELRGYVLGEVARRRAGQVTIGQRLIEYISAFNPRLVSVATGVVVSVVSFTALFASFRPIPVNGRVTVRASIPAVSGSDEEFHAYNDLTPDGTPHADAHYYQLPRVLDNSALVSFNNAASRTPGNETMAAMVQVGPDGRAVLVDVLGEPKDPRVIEELWWSLQDRTFQPAFVSGRPVSTRIILLVEKVDVRG
jgi:hypothetical protein